MLGCAAPARGGGPMIPASTNGAPVVSITAAIRRAVAGLTALQSTNTGFRAAPWSAGAISSANASAEAGGTMESRICARTSSSEETARIPAEAARAALAALRPSRVVSTSTAWAVRSFPTAAPILPGATTATTRVMSAGPDSHPRWRRCAARGDFEITSARCRDAGPREGTPAHHCSGGVLPARAVAARPQPREWWLPGPGCSC